MKNVITRRVSKRCLWLLLHQPWSHLNVVLRERATGKLPARADAHRDSQFFQVFRVEGIQHELR